jgi:hypothetical protein
MEICYEKFLSTKARTQSTKQVMKNSYINSKGAQSPVIFIKRGAQFPNRATKNFNKKEARLVFFFLLWMLSLASCPFSQRLSCCISLDNLLHSRRPSLNPFNHRDLGSSWPLILLHKDYSSSRLGIHHLFFNE